MKVVTKEYLKNSLVDYAKDVLGTRGIVQEVTSLPSTVENKIYNISEATTIKVLTDYIETMSYNDFKDYVEFCWELKNSWESSSGTTFKVYAPYKTTKIGDKEIYSVWWNDNNSTTPHIAYTDSGYTDYETNEDEIWSTGEKDINFGPYEMVYHQFGVTSTSPVSIKSVLTTLLGEEPTESKYEDLYVIATYSNGSLIINSGNAPATRNSNGEYYISTASGSSAAEISNSNSETTSYITFAYYAPYYTEEPGETIKKVSSKDVRLERQPVELTSEEYNLLVASDKVETDVVYYVTDEDEDADIVVDQSYSPESSNAQSGVAISKALAAEDYVKLDDDSSITGTKTFTTIKIGDCTFSSSNGVLQVN